MGPGRIFVDPRAYADLRGWHETAARLRREDPVHRVEAEGFDPFWAVTRHADIIDVERQPDRFWNTTDSVLRVQGALERARASGADLKTLIHMDGAEHRAYRGITNDWFKPAQLRRTLESAVTSWRGGRSTAWPSWGARATSSPTWRSTTPCASS